MKETQNQAPAPGAEVPAGWKLVPEEPTVEMGWAYLDAARLHAADGAADTMRFSWGGYRAMLEAAPPAPCAAVGDDDWQHLKQYGYAPGGYMSRCHKCGSTSWDADKRAITCRPCAEAMHAERQANESTGETE